MWFDFGVFGDDGDIGIGDCVVVFVYDGGGFFQKNV